MRQPISSVRYRPALYQLAVIRSHVLRRASSSRTSSNCVFAIFTCENSTSSNDTCAATWLLKLTPERERERYCSLSRTQPPGIPSTSFLFISFVGLIVCSDFGYPFFFYIFYFIVVCW